VNERSSAENHINDYVEAYLFVIYLLEWSNFPRRYKKDIKSIEQLH